MYVLLVSTPIVAWLGDFAARHLPSVLGQFTAPAAVLAAFAVIIAGISFLEPAGQGAHSSLLRPARARRPRVRQ